MGEGLEVLGVYVNLCNMDERDLVKLSPIHVEGLFIPN